MQLAAKEKGITPLRYRQKGEGGGKKSLIRNREGKDALFEKKKDRPTSQIRPRKRKSGK